MATQSDITYALVENVNGVTPGSPVMLNLDYQPGNELSLSGKTINSPVVNNNTRSLQGARIVDLTGGGSLVFVARRDEAVKKLIGGAVGAVDAAAAVIKAGRADRSFTIEKKMLLDTASYHRYSEVYVSKFAASFPASDYATFTFEFAGRGRTDVTQIMNGATYVTPARGAAFSGDRMKVMNIGGITTKVLDLQFETSLTREMNFGLGSDSAIQINASSTPRVTKVTAKVLRSSLAVDLLRNTEVPVSFTVGEGANNELRFLMPRALATLPMDSTENGGLVVTIEFLALEDTTLGTELTITEA